jgi:hypothetical protein
MSCLVIGLRNQACSSGVEWQTAAAAACRPPNPFYPIAFGEVTP